MSRPRPARSPSATSPTPPVTVAVELPNSTVSPDAVALNPVPVIVTVLSPPPPPATVDVTVGGASTCSSPRPTCRRLGHRHVDRPRRPAGAVTVSEVADADVTVAALDPKSTVAPGTKFAPVMVTVLPPPVDPLVGLIDVTVGAV